METVVEKPKRKPIQRSSENIKAVARDVVAKMQAGEKIVLGKIITAHGYGPGMAINPKKVTEKKEYKEIIDSYVQRLEKHRLKIITAMEEKNLSEEQYRTLVEAQSKTTHDVQLLSGGKTENVGVEKDRETLKAIVAAIQVER